ncbi:polysaccharide deacetylase family protein [Accumulibacter sp.]|uniref:polysaccharide deacetylase family protein n=1 Tax=Accumulibacter sp. TaxID=2053492 RepID=UPI00260F2056|nr:polysaccharide deacetylase family protein [Accumulibacter sp.]
MALWKTAYRMLAPGGRRGKLLIFIFHQVLREPDPLRPYEPDAEQFDWMVQHIARNFSVLPLADAAARLAAGSLPPAAACITFDDGYRNNAELALPILRRHGAVATFFVASGFLGQGRMWNDDLIEAVRQLGSADADWRAYGLGVHRLTTPADRLQCLADVLPRLKYFPHAERASVAREVARAAGVAEESSMMMEAEHLAQLIASGMEIGAHTHSHPILGQIGPEEARAEVARGRSELERMTGHPIRLFAYPNGDTRRDLGQRDVDLVRDLGFACAVITDPGFAVAATNPYLLPRFTPWDRTPGRFAMRCSMALAGRL